MPQGAPRGVIESDMHRAQRGMHKAERYGLQEDYYYYMHKAERYMHMTDRDEQCSYFLA
jgi:hypothetical protein